MDLPCLDSVAISIKKEPGIEDEVERETPSTFIEIEVQSIKEERPEVSEIIHQTAGKKYCYINTVAFCFWLLFSIFKHVYILL